MTVPQIQAKIAEAYGRQNVGVIEFSSHDRGHREINCPGTPSTVLVWYDADRRARQYSLLSRMSGGVWLSGDGCGPLDGSVVPVVAKVIRIGKSLAGVFEFTPIQITHDACFSQGKWYSILWGVGNKELFMHTADDPVSDYGIATGVIEMSGPYDTIRLEARGPVGVMRER